MSHEERARLRVERQLMRQSVMHHVRREQQLEQLLADAIALSATKCKCRTCKSLRQLAAELEGSR